MKRILMAGVLIGMIMLVCLTPQAYAASNEKAIIVKGTQPSGGNNTAFQHNTELAYKELTQHRNISADNITYLDGNASLPDRDAIANKTNLNKSITEAKNNCTPGGKLTIYITTHGGNDTLDIGPDTVTAAELKTWIDAYRNACPGSQVVIVIQACHSGSFIDDLKGDNTTVITSCRANQTSYGFECVGSHFSQPFWKNITDNCTLTEAFKKASDAVSKQNKKMASKRPPETPLYEDDGNGEGHTAPLPNGGDGDRTKDLKIGENISTNSRPVIEDKTPDQSVAPGTSKVLNVTATDDKNVTRVYGRVLTPDFDFCDPDNETCFWDPETINFTNVGGDLWQYNYTFGMVGDYYIMLLAEDNESSRSYAEWIDINALGGVGGIVELPQIEEPGTATPDLSDHNYGALAGIIAGAIASVIALISAVWYIRRRRTNAI